MNPSTTLLRNITLCASNTQRRLLYILLKFNIKVKEHCWMYTTEKFVVVGMNAVVCAADNTIFTELKLYWKLHRQSGLFFVIVEYEDAPFCTIRIAIQRTNTFVSSF